MNVVTAGQRRRKKKKWDPANGGGPILFVTALRYLAQKMFVRSRKVPLGKDAVDLVTFLVLA
ncbi:MAG: hypothetical protein ACXVAM_17730 [Vulcanimicrobiaceae bacterium]